MMPGQDSSLAGQRHPTNPTHFAPQVPRALGLHEEPATGPLDPNWKITKVLAGVVEAPVLADGPPWPLLLPQPTYPEIPRKPQQLKGSGLSHAAVARRLEVIEKTVARAIA
jgi:hypothetical protein